MTDHQSLHSIKSNEQRLKSLEEYEREKQTKKRLIKDSLENRTKTKHLQFDSDNEDNQPKEFLQKKIQLFDDNEILDVEEHFTTKKIPKKRKKLQDLQARLTTTNDPRFQFSEQFLDDHSKAINDEDEEMENNNDISIEEEQKKSLAILDQITNARISIPKPKTKMVRFDPSKTEHRMYEVQPDIKTNGGNFNTSEDIKVKSTSKGTTPVIDSTRTYDFDESKLKTLFDKTTATPTTISKENGQFQFQFFNNKELISTPTTKTFPISKPISNGKSKISANKPGDTSSDEDDHDKASLPDEVEIKNETFFFFDIDDRLKDGLESFVRTEDLNELERAWPVKRKEIGEALRTKHRKAIQRKDNHRVFNHRRRQNQYSSSNPKSKSDMD